MKILIVLNQIVKISSQDHFDYVIGVDGGCINCLKHNIYIDLAIGDFDSLDKPSFEKIRLHAGDIVKFNAEKDETDLELAIDAAMGLNPDQITVVGVWGGRIDHSLANLLCLSMQTNQVPIVMPGTEQSGYLIKNKQTIEINSKNKQLISILAMGGDCFGISNKGLIYPLENATLKQGTARGLSNETVSKSCQISLQQGILLVMVDKSCPVSIF